MIDDYEKILFDNETQFFKMSEAYFNNFLQSLKKHLDEDSRNLLFTEENLTSEELFGNVYDYIFCECPQYINIFFELLEKFGYNSLNEICTYMALIGNNDPLSLEVLFEILTQSPFVDKVLFNNGLIVIESKLGTFEFIHAQEYFKDNEEILDYLFENDTTQNCHNCSLDILKKLRKGTLITVLVQAEFVGTCYHTVLQDEKGNIVDIANKAVYTLDTFHKLYNGLTIVSMTDIKDIDDEISQIRSEIRQDLHNTEYSPALLLALHKSMEINSSKKMH